METRATPAPVPVVTPGAAGALQAVARRLAALQAGVALRAGVEIREQPAAARRETGVAARVAMRGAGVKQEREEVEKVGMVTPGAAEEAERGAAEVAEREAAEEAERGAAEVAGRGAAEVAEREAAGMLGVVAGRRIRRRAPLA